MQYHSKFVTFLVKRHFSNCTCRAFLSYTDENENALNSATNECVGELMSEGATKAPVHARANEKRNILLCVNSLISLSSHNSEPCHPMVLEASFFTFRDSYLRRQYLAHIPSNSLMYNLLNVLCTLADILSNVPSLLPTPPLVTSITVFAGA